MAWRMAWPFARTHSWYPLVDLLALAWLLAPPTAGDSGSVRPDSSLVSVSLEPLAPGSSLSSQPPAIKYGGGTSVPPCQAPTLQGAVASALRSSSSLAWDKSASAGVNVLAGAGGSGGGTIRFATLFLARGAWAFVGCVALARPQYAHSQSVGNTAAKHLGQSIGSPWPSAFSGGSKTWSPLAGFDEELLGPAGLALTARATAWGG